MEVETGNSTLAKLRPLDNSMKGVTESCIARRIDVTEEEWRLIDDIYARIGKLNQAIPVPRSQELITEMVHEVWREFFESNDVSRSSKGIRYDLNKQHTQIFADDAALDRIDHFLDTRDDTTDPLSFDDFMKWVTELSHGDIILEANYFAKFHHCRWYEDATEPKLNYMNVSSGRTGTSYRLALISRTCPSGVVQLAAESAFNTDVNLNDALVISEETSHYMLFPKSQGSDGTNSNTLNRFRNTLTTSKMSTLSFFIDSENGNRRDMKVVYKSTQGTYMLASNANLTDADPHVLSRFVVVNVPPLGVIVNRPVITDRQIAQHRDLHRIYYIVECMCKSNVVSVDTTGADMFCTEIGDPQHLTARQKHLVLEMARTLCITSTVWCVMVSPEFKHLQCDKKHGKYIGLNPRIFVEGIFPLLVVTKQMVHYAYDLVITLKKDQ